MTILWVEDDDSNFRLVERIMLLDGHEVERARDGETAVRMVAARRPDIVLLDLALPGIDGFETARRMRDVSSPAGVPIVALTGMVGEADRERAKREGFAGYVEKPFRMDPRLQLRDLRLLRVDNLEQPIDQRPALFERRGMNGWRKGRHACSCRNAPPKARNRHAQLLTTAAPPPERIRLE